MTIENILTVDVEDWFHICGVNNIIPRESWDRLESRVAKNTLKILNIINRSKTKATFFILGYIAEKHPELVKEINSSGHEIASHGHVHRRVYTMTPDSFRRDLKKSTQVISRIIGRSLKGFRAAEWSIREDSLWALDILLQEGFLYDSSMAPLPIIGNPKYSTAPYRYKLNSGNIWELPPLVALTPLVNLPLGGGWGLRTFPYSMIRSAIDKHNRLGFPALVYLHPREFDQNCPRIKLPFIKKLVLQAGIASTEKRLNLLLKDYKFTTAANYLSG